VTAGKYTRPELPPPGALDEARRRLSARLDAHAAAEGKTPARGRRPSFRPLPLEQLAPAIARQNAERRARSDEALMRDNAAGELLLACDTIRDEIEREGACDAKAVHMFQAAVREFLGALGSADAGPREADRIAAMREAIASLDARMGRGQP
jgi:hypothetical protein